MLFLLKFDSNVMEFCLTMHVNLGMSLRKAKYALKELYNINISHQQVANYCKTAPFALSHSQIIMITMLRKFILLIKHILKSEISKPSSSSLWMPPAIPLLDSGYPRNMMSEHVSLPCVWHSGISTKIWKTSVLLQMGTVHIFGPHSSSCINTAVILNLTSLSN